MRRLLSALSLTTLVAAAACGGAQGQAPSSPTPNDAQMVPLGYGRLNQDDISIRLTSGDLEVRFVPLEERILRLLASDAYRALHDLRESRRAAIDSIAHRYGIASPGVALVTYFAARAGQQYQPQDIALSVQGQEFRALSIVPISSNFSNQQLANRDQASALYIFEMPVPVMQEFTLSYGAIRTDAWRSRVTTISREQERLLLRARSAEADSTRSSP